MVGFENARRIGSGVEETLDESPQRDLERRKKARAGSRKQAAELKQALAGAGGDMSAVLGADPQPEQEAGPPPLDVEERPPAEASASAGAEAAGPETAPATARGPAAPKTGAEAEPATELETGGDGAGDPEAPPEDAPAAEDAPGGVTVFKSVGIALEDVAVAARIWRRAEAAGS